MEHFEAGDKTSGELVVFLQGWPDNATLWDWINWKDELSSKHLLFINFPNTNGKVDIKWGKDFPEIIEDLKVTIDSVVGISRTKILVGHDWGCFYGYMFDQKYPNYFDQLIMMDVPGKVELKNLKETIFVVIYQMVLLVAFLVGGPLGKFLTQSSMKFFKHNPPYATKVSSSQNYPYYYLWRNTVLSALKLKTKYLSRYTPSAPTTYLYGANKPFQFHGEKWLKAVQESGGDVHRMEAGHWFMKKYAKFITDLIHRKLKAKL